MILRCSVLAGAFALCLSGQIRLNEIQIIGSHNSYHTGLAPSDMELLRKRNPKAADALDYRHPALETQLNDGVRQLELDVFGDAKGGLFARPAYPDLVVKAGLPADPPFDPEHAMEKPGFKVLHVQDIDYRSNCEPFTQCLTIIRDWSKAHPEHLPIFILVENKDGKPAARMTQPEALTPETFDALDAEIRLVFTRSEMIVPDDVRGNHATLEEAVLTGGWPALDQCRGKVVFLLDQRRVGPLYVQGHPSLRGRVLFTNAEPGTPDAAFVEMNNPTPVEHIQELVRKGYIVRTMTDPGPQGVREGATQRRDAAMASGAQILSTDYPYQERAPGSHYSVSFDDGNAHCNPVLKPSACDAASLRDGADVQSDRHRR
ncbi:MAG TPA: phosphatidylinositol-specific phospholipase C1-like protein [Bryobacteraceae bacterium]|nr:phosphatidylinositol-specific phospholipase C1-like protein [Bryobacteraceae bacterium]